jgi:uncharacterized protein YecT (DUF1311 family)
MKRLLLLLLAVCTPVFGMWALVPLSDLVRESDTIVIGTLAEVKEWTKDRVDYGSGTLVVREVLKGTPKTNPLRLVWQNPSDLVCPRMEHSDSGGNALVWLLQTNASDGSVAADYPGKVLDLSERAKVEAELVTVQFKLASSARPDEELTKLEASLAEAMTQTDMTLRSGAIAQHLDERLVRVEGRIAADLEPDARALFQKAARLWREYRSAQVDFEGDLYRGGSIQPLIHNRTFIRLTKERLDALRTLGAEGEYEAF